MATGISRLVLPVGDRDHIAGSVDAPITLVEYGDYECPYCGRAFHILREVQARLGPRLRLVFRHFPMSEVHPHAEAAAEAAEAASAQGKFWAMHERLFTHQRELDADDLIRHAAEVGIDTERMSRELADRIHQPRVREDFATGVRSGVNGTPTFFIHGIRYDGFWDSAERLVEALTEASTE